MSPAAKTPARARGAGASARTPPRSPIGEAGGRASITSGTAPAPMTTRVGARAQRPPFVTTRGDAPVGALEALELVAAVDLDAVLLEPLLEVAPGLARRSRARASTSSCMTIAQRLPQQRQRGRDLAADVGAADQHDVLGVLGVGADRVGVAERAQVVDALQLGSPSTLQPPHVRAGGEQRLVEARRSSLLDSVASVRRGVELHHARARAAARCRCSSHHSSGRKQRVLARLLALQVALRARRAGCRAGRARGRRAGSSPSQPASRSQRAQLARGQPAADQQVRRPSRSGHRSTGSRRCAMNCGVIVGLEARVEDQQHLVAGLDDGVGLGHEAAAAAQHRDDQAALGQLDVVDALAGRRRVLGDLELDDLQPLLLERRAGARARTAGTSCSIRRRIRSVAETAGWMPSSLKCCRLRGLLTRAMIRSHRYFSLATWQMSMLSSSSPVTAITRSARWMPARSSTHSSVASPYWTACSSSCSTIR